MPEDLSGLSQLKLKARKKLANLFKKSLESEVATMDKYIAKIDELLITDPDIPKIPFNEMTNGQLNELKIIYSRTITRIRGMEAGYAVTFKQIDAEIVSRQ